MDQRAFLQYVCISLYSRGAERSSKGKKEGCGRTIRHNVLSAEADEFDSVGIVVQRFIAKREFHVHHKKERSPARQGARVERE
jgi:hypothetical protein